MKIYLFIVITLIFFGSIVFASDYYIDARNGNDSKNGLSKANAWQTWDKLRVQTYTIGDTISFKCGEQWDIPYNNYWTFDDSGTVNNYIEITSYGTGPKPIWNAVESISGSWSDKGWNIWKRKLNGRVERCILGDIESVEADNVEDIDGISKYWYGDDSCLYVYSKSNPDIVYSQVKVVRIGWCILFQNANYVKLNNIELRGGSVDTIRLRNNCSYISIENCIITYSGKSGIMGMVEEGSGNTLTNVVIKNNFISGEQDLVNKTIRGINEDGISMWRACSDWHIIGNTIKNYSHSGISIQTYTSSESGSNNNIIEDNTFTAGNSPYFRAFDFHGPEGKCMRNIFRNNLCTGCNIRIQVGGDHNKVYNNIIIKTRNSSITTRQNLAEGISLGGGITSFGGSDYTFVSHDNEVLNNTFYDIYNAGIRLYSSYAYKNVIKNNIIYNAGQSSIKDMNICVSIESTVTGSNIIKNNCFYNTYSSDVINYKGKMYTVGDANGKLIDFKNNIGSNPLFYKDQYTIQSDSPCKDTGETLPDVTEDYRKLKRPQDSDYDMGAMEYGGVMK